MSDALDPPVTADDLAPVVVALAKRVRDLEERCAACPHREPVRLGFVAPEHDTDCEGTSVAASSRTHEQDCDPDEFEGRRR